jgi:23S rRNA pseudouridine2605 synthase
MAEERLQKILAQAGIASRRKAELLMLEGRVSVNGETVNGMGAKADAERDQIKVDGALIHLPKRHVYVALNKPREVVTTVSDPQGRTTVMHFVKGVRERVFPVGRLDYNSEGLLLLTTDGDFANRVTSPAGHVEKVYVVKSNGRLSDEQLEDFRQGIPLHGRRTAPAHIKLIRQGDNPWYEVRLTEGRQNQIRIMFKHFHRLVEKLRRVRIGFLTLSGLEPGMWRYLEAQETERLLRLVHLEAPVSRHAAHASGHDKTTPREHPEPAPEPAPPPVRQAPAPRPAPQQERRPAAAGSPQRGNASQKYRTRRPVSRENPPHAPEQERRPASPGSPSRGNAYQKQRPHRPPSSQRPRPAPQQERRPAAPGSPQRGNASQKYRTRRPVSRENPPHAPEQERRPAPSESPSRGNASQKQRPQRPPSSQRPRPASEQDRRSASSGSPSRGNAYQKQRPQRPTSGQRPRPAPEQDRRPAPAGSPSRGNASQQYGSKRPPSSQRPRPASQQDRRPAPAGSLPRGKSSQQYGANRPPSREPSPPSQKPARRPSSGRPAPNKHKR